MSVRVFVDDMSISFSRWSKTDCPVSCGQSPMQSTDNMEAALLISRRQFPYYLELSFFFPFGLEM